MKGNSPFPMAMGAGPGTLLTSLISTTVDMKVGILNSKTTAEFVHHKCIGTAECNDYCQMTLQNRV